MNEHDTGGAFLAWYTTIAKKHPGGLVTQSQAANMLRLSRMAVARLVATGHLRAEYFPVNPPVPGILPSSDDPMWRTICKWIEQDLDPTEARQFPKACYVSFADVKKLYANSDARMKATKDWLQISGGTE
jgi:hypothetical protein